ncbi:DUF106 domain-containing protein [Halorussus halophilus]|uniref:DUF106 domain-containing protein n=1 Tax=Halorussus halophilus TaxID=2650975 RepID=UPI0013017C56|nr:EMC3/TMCO1 family protein [Halorussus halophilus]
MSDQSANRWRPADKLAGVVALLLMTGYYVQPIQQGVGTAMQALLAPAATFLPFSLLILLLAGTTGLSSAVLSVKLRSQQGMEDLQERMNDVQERLSDARERDDEEAIEELQVEQQEMMGDMLGVMKGQLRPMAWSMLVSIPAFLWLRWVFLAPSVAIAPAAFALPIVGQIAWTASLVGPIKVWLAWYIGCSLSTGMVTRKVVARFA